MGTIPLNPPYQRGTLRIEFLKYQRTLSNYYCICSILLEILYYNSTWENFFHYDGVISNTEMVPTNGDYPPKSPLSKGDFENRVS